MLRVRHSHRVRLRMQEVERLTSRDGLRFRHRMIAHPAPRFTPTLFVSGAFQTMDSWVRFARAFAPHTTVLLVDPPGMGASDLLPADYDVDFLAECLEQVLDERGMDRASVIAASYGTASAFQFALRNPDRIDRTALVGTMKELPLHMRERIARSAWFARHNDRIALAQEVVDGMLCHDPARPIDRREAAARVLRSGILRMDDAELLKYAANTERLLNHEPLDLDTCIAGPEAMVFTGEHDAFTLPEECRRVAGAFETAWFTTVRRADHLLHLQQWDTVIDLLLRFIGRTLPAAGTSGCNALERLPARACG